MTMRRFVLFLPDATHAMLERGAKRLKSSKALYARLLLDTGEAMQEVARKSSKQFPPTTKHK